MYLGVSSVEYYKDYKILLIFENNEKKVFDVSPYLDKGNFKELKETKLFKTVHIAFDTIEWDNGVDLDPETLYSDSKPLNPSPN